ncbi:hypothetical protein Pmani_030721 [Petrolisthes manimaculis]|uniref:Secreted protein n=1 Tax=Petrolisthes manimaculis TaxID=1843537 RepID=A0AAE1NX83_9EUCA|nr:hypothetical protein Pmani_030721 [Petrolisthes manimaculis]
MDLDWPGYHSPRLYSYLVLSSLRCFVVVIGAVPEQCWCGCVKIGNGWYCYSHVLPLPSVFFTHSPHLILHTGQCYGNGDKNELAGDYTLVLLWQSGFLLEHLLSSSSLSYQSSSA